MNAAQFKRERPALLSVLLLTLALCVAALFGKVSLADEAPSSEAVIVEDRQVDEDTAQLAPDEEELAATEGEDTTVDSQESVPATPDAGDQNQTIPGDAPASASDAEAVNETNGEDQELNPGEQEQAEQLDEALEQAKADGGGAANSGTPVLTYRAHVQNIGWQGWVGAGKMAGTSGKALRVEAFDFKLENASGDIEMRAHVQNIGWQDWTPSGTIAGTSGRGLRVEALQIRLTGNIEEKYDVRYRVHVQNKGWTSWMANGATAGTTGQGLRLEAIEITLVAKGSVPDAPITESVQLEPGVNYQTHVQNIGWQGWVANGKTAGTSGKAYRLEAIGIKLDGIEGSVRYKTHVQNIGWQGWVRDGKVSGTSGKGLRLEAIQIELVDGAEKNYDIWYRVHVQNVGWLGWAKNGTSAGSAGHGWRLEAIEIQLLEKGAAAPGSSDYPFVGSNVWKLGWQNPSQYYQVSIKSTPVPAAARRYGADYITPPRIGIFATRDQCVEAAIKRAYEYIGTPYRWAYSKAPGVGVDCSGMVIQCLMATGMQMKYNPYYDAYTTAWPRTTMEMIADPKFMHVSSYSQAKRGDLIFYSGHVGIYLGGGKWIEAIQPRVRISNVNASKVVCVLRPYVG